MDASINEMGFVFYAVVADKKYKLFLRKLFFFKFLFKCIDVLPWVWGLLEMELQTYVTPVGC